MILSKRGRMDMSQTAQEQSSPYRFLKGQLNSLVYSRNPEISRDSPDITFQTMRPADENCCFIHRFLAPEYDATGTLDRKLAGEYLDTKGLHQHDYFELLYVIQGHLYQRIETERHLYPEGSLCLLNRSIRHQEEFHTDCFCAFLRLPVPFVEILLRDMDSFYFAVEKEQKERITKRFFSQNLQSSFYLKKEYIDFIPVSDAAEVKADMRALFDSLTNVFVAPEVLILKIFQELANKKHYNTVPLNIGTDAEAELFASINDILKKNHGRVSRSQLQEALSYNPDYLNRITKKYTGMSLRQYGTTLCIKEAEHLLRTTDMTVMEICEKLHFTNYTFFYRAFEEAYGTTPKKYRKNR